MSETLDDRVRRLEERLLALETAASAEGQQASFAAPFQVLASDGKPLLRVQECETGALLILFNSAGTRQIVMTAEADRSAVVVRSLGTRSVTMHADAKENGFSVRNASGKNIIGLGSADEGGRLAVADDSGKVVAVVGMRGGFSPAIAGERSAGEELPPAQESPPNGRRS